MKAATRSSRTRSTSLCLTWVCPTGIDVSDPAQRRAMMRADQDARELRLIDPDNPHVPDLTKIKQQITDSSSAARTLAVRDPRMRVEMVRREGGTTLTEAAVARGLRWLARHQNTDGSWSLDRFHRVDGCDCGDRGSLESESAGTSLALLPFLGAGQTHLTGIYQAEVAKGLRWLLQNQREDGDLRGSPGQYPGMYAQGQGAIVLCEAFLMTGDEALRVPAQQAIDFIVAAQYPDGGWRYYPRSETHESAGRHERRGLAADGPPECLGGWPVGSRGHAGKRRPLPRHGATRRWSTLLVSAARTGQCPDDGGSPIVPHLSGLETQSPAPGRLHPLDAHTRTALARIARISTTGTTLRRPSITLAAPNGMPGICRCAMCWSPRRKPTGMRRAAGPPPVRSRPKAAAST